MKPLLALLLAALPLCLTAEEIPGTWTNPIVPKRADPHVHLDADGYYYLTATHPDYDRIELRRAKTLGGLADAKVKTIWRKHRHGPMGAHIWAPEIHRIGKKWYIYFAAGDAEDIWKIRMYALENSSENPLEGNWTEKGQIKMNFESFTLDGDFFTHKGKPYFVWAQTQPIEGHVSSIYIAEMDTPTSIKGKQVLISQPELNWETRGHKVNEAPCTIVHDGKIYLAYSASATDANYCLGLLSADENADLLDPKSWTKSQESVFKSSPETSQYGPGHNCFTTSPDGKTTYLVYHSRNYEKINGEPLHNPDRATRAQVLTWKPDGSPDFGIPAPDGPYPPK